MRPDKESAKKANPSTLKKLATVKQGERKILDDQVQTLKQEILFLNKQLKKIKSAKKKDQELVQQQLALLKYELASVSAQTKVLQDSNAHLATALNSLGNSFRSSLKNAQETIIELLVNGSVPELQKQNALLLEEMQKQRRTLEHVNGTVQELLWASTFNSTLKPEDRAIPYSPGRWAIGYPAFYAIYRILSSVSPRNILELGLGQSTVMIGDYVAKHPNVKHTVVERNPEWVEFFTAEHKPTSNTNIVVLDYDFVEYGGKPGVRVFKDFENAIKPGRFDFVCIDAPWGFDMTDYSRIDVLRSLSANFLADKFVILVDDTNREPEAKMVEAMRAVLFGRGIATVVGKYKGDKECTVICTENYAFLTSM